MAGEQVHLEALVVAAAAQGLAVDGQRPLRPVGWGRCGRLWLLGGQPAADHPIQRVRVDAR